MTISIAHKVLLHASLEVSLRLCLISKSTVHLAEPKCDIYIYIIAAYNDWFVQCSICKKFSFPDVNDVVFGELTYDKVLLSSPTQAYRDTQEELTAELADFKEKYREIAGLLHDTQRELKNANVAKRKRMAPAAGGATAAPGVGAAPYPGAGRHHVSKMFSSSPPGPQEKEEKGALTAYAEMLVHLVQSGPLDRSAVCQS